MKTNRVLHRIVCLFIKRVLMWFEVVHYCTCAPWRVKNLKLHGYMFRHLYIHHHQACRHRGVMKTNRHRILWNTSVHYRVHKRPPLAPVMREINPVHMKNINSIVSSMPNFWNGFFPLRFPQKCCILVFSMLCHTACSSHILGHDQPNNIWRRVQIMKILAMPISPVSYYFFPRRPPIPSSTL
jgi:hypothetical protein